MDNQRIAKSAKKIVCLGGGVGTANLLRGLKDYFSDLTAIVSMADDGGSAGRLRRLYKIPPPGDVINCMVALSGADKTLKDVLKYRFPGNRYDTDNSLPGQKLGNLLFVALKDVTGSSELAFEYMQQLFQVQGKIHPSTTTGLSISAKTSTGHIVKREENIDLGKFKGKITRLYIHPAHPPVLIEVIDAIENADVIIAGPGDLYTTIIPVLLIPAIQDAIKQSRAKKIFVVNVANKYFETPEYAIEDYANAIKKHCKEVLFTEFFVNDNTVHPIPTEWKHEYAKVKIQDADSVLPFTVSFFDLIDEQFPLYHDSKKLAKAIAQAV